MRGAGELLQAAVMRTNRCRKKRKTAKNSANTLIRGHTYIEERGSTRREKKKERKKVFGFSVQLRDRAWV